jgi:Homeodomain-like domain
MSDDDREDGPRAHSGAGPLRRATGENAANESAKTNPIATTRNAMQRDGTACNPNAQIGETNPPAHSGARPPRDGPEMPENARSGLTADEIGETNPPAHSGARAARELSPRQLAAARLLARGHGTMRVSGRLGVNRHTIARWKRDPLFAAELQRLLDALCHAAVRLRTGSRVHGYFDFLPAQHSDGPRRPQSMSRHPPAAEM